MYHYQAFGLRFASDVPLAGFAPPTEASNAPEVRIEAGRLEAGALPRVNNDGSVIAGRAEGVMQFLVEEGRSITYDPFPDADPGFVRALLTGELLATVLRQRGLLVLHGSGVVREGRAVAFVGFSGWGKSTLATYFSAQGYGLLTDDVLAIDVDEGATRVLPGHVQVKLRADAAAHLVADHERLPQAHEHTDKRLFIGRLGESVDHPVRLERVYLLEGEARAELRLVPLAPMQALPELLRHTRVTQLIKAPSYAAGHLEQCAALLRAVPMRRLERPHALDRLGEIYHLIEDDLA